MFVTFRTIHYGAINARFPAPTVTAAELVALLNRIAIDPTKTGERLKHWARVGLLEPSGEQFPGTGRHRRYDLDAVTTAAVLTAFADMRVTVVGMEGSLSRAMAQAYAVRRRWRRGQARRSTSSSPRGGARAADCCRVMPSFTRGRG